MKKYKVKVVCMYCKRIIGYKDFAYPVPKNQATHGICDKCLPKIMGEIRKSKKNG